MLFLSHAVLFGPLICTGKGKLLVKYAVVFFHCTDKGKLLVKLKTIMSDLLHLTEKERLLILYCTDKRRLFMKIRCYYTASRGIGKAISKTMLSYLRYRTEKGR